MPNIRATVPLPAEVLLTGTIGAPGPGTTGTSGTPGATDPDTLSGDTLP